MRLIIIILCFFLLAYCLGVRPLLRQPVMKISAILLALILIPSIIFEIRWQRTEQIGTGIVQYVSQKPAGHLTCQRFMPALLDITNRAGEVSSKAPDVAYVHYETCQNLRDWLESDKTNPSLNQIIALHVLVHESVHVSGDYNEASTECKAIGDDVAVAEKLGADPEVAQQMHRRYLQEVYPRLGASYHGVCPAATVTPSG